MPSISTVLPGYEAGSWFGIGAPKGTSAEIVAALNGSVNEALSSANISGQIAGLGGTVMRLRPDEFAAFIAAETERYAGVIRKAGIKPK